MSASMIAYAPNTVEGMQAEESPRGIFTWFLPVLAASQPILTLFPAACLATLSIPTILARTIPSASVLTSAHGPRTILVRHDAPPYVCCFL